MLPLMTSTNNLPRLLLIAAGAIAAVALILGVPRASFVAEAGVGPKTCFGKKITIRGTPGNDFGENSLVGTNGSDVIFGGRGNDFIDGKRGKDLICGGNGSDLILGGKGRDKISGGNKGDVLAGGDGNDKLLGNRGADQLDGEKGFDTCKGGRGDDVANRQGCERAKSTTFTN